MIIILLVCIQQPGRNPGGLLPPGLMGSPGAPPMSQVGGMRQLPPPPPMGMPPPPRGQFGHMMPPQFPVSGCMV